MLARKIWAFGNNGEYTNGGGRLSWAARARGLTEAAGGPARGLSLPLAIAVAIFLADHHQWPVLLLRQLILLLHTQAHVKQ